MQLLPALDGGGVERGTVEIAAALIDAGHQAIVVSAGGRLTADLDAIGARHIEMAVGRKSLSTLFLAGQLSKLICETGTNVVHARSRLPAWVSWRALQRLSPRPRFVTTMHGLNAPGRYSRIMTRGDRVIAVSEACRDYWQGHYPRLDPDRVSVIHRGIDPQSFPYGHQPGEQWQQAFRQQFEIPADRRLLCLPGRVARSKGHESFLSLLAALQRKEMPCHGVVVGGVGRAGYGEALKQQAESLGIAGQVSWTGARRDVADIMASCDLVYSLSVRPESFGRTVIEALALGRPVIGWDHGGVGETLSELFPAGKVKLGDEEALLRASLKMLTDPPGVPDRQPYLLSTMTSRTVALYESMF